LEDVVLKRRDAPYILGHGLGWLKIKCAARDEFAIIGWTDPAGNREGLGPLLLGYYDSQGTFAMPAASAQGHPRCAARSEKPIGSAVNTARRAEIAAAAPTRSYWVRPEPVAEVRFTEWTRDRRRRHPVFLCLREEKKGPEVVLDPAVGTALDRTAGDKEVSALRPKHQTLRSK
jgi:bifunctional non-homologous end joining protein LigD